MSLCCVRIYNLYVDVTGVLARYVQSLSVTLRKNCNSNGFTPFYFKLDNSNVLKILL